MDATKPEKCAHPVCSCTVTTGKYCSLACESMENMPDIDCHCGHEGCKGDVDTLDASRSASAS